MNLWKEFRSGCAAISPNCRAASQAQSEALDHRLGPARRLGLWLHLLICKWCRRYGQHIRFMHAAVHEHQEVLVEATPQKLSENARERIRRRLQEEIE